MLTLPELNQQIEECQSCLELAASRNTVVPGEGNEHAPIVFIGEAPGFHEDQRGRPFVGQAGQFLDYLLNSIGLNRNDVFICNFIKCRPRNNRDPLPDEIKNCQKWLDCQLEIISPKMIVTLGRYSLAKFLPGETIGKIHGKARMKDNIIFYPMYHPAAALHQQSLRLIIEEDMKKIPELLASSEKKGEESGKPQQLSMF
jgi:DNA polymerase